MKRPITSKIDIWSLGCVFLEFITWLVLGSDGLEKFHDSRVEKTFDSLGDDAYHTLIVTKDGDPVSAVVRPSVVAWIANLRRERRCSQAFGEILTLIEEHLLIAEPKNRIPALDLLSRLEGILEESKDSYAFLVGSNPLDEGRCFKLPLGLSIS